MTTETKNEIRARIIKACGGDIGEIQPQFFMSGEQTRFAFADNTLSSCPHFVILLINKSGAGLRLGMAGCN
jgi:hypothetical protein